ncbi:MAG: hypothetical protein CMH62_00370 [Nanoarchaeota archaeon]|nr:hypothetical protein [Nanoarchaeota archaeon]
MPAKTNKVQWRFPLRYIAPIIIILAGFYFLSLEYQRPITEKAFWPWVVITVGAVWLVKEFKK